MPIIFDYPVENHIAIISIVLYLLLEYFQNRNHHTFILMQIALI